MDTGGNSNLFDKAECTRRKTDLWERVHDTEVGIETTFSDLT